MLLIKKLRFYNVHCFASFEIFNYHIGMVINQFIDSLYFNSGWIKEAVTAILFPDVCLCCGVRQSKQYICDYCMRRRFQQATNNRQRASGDTLLPDGVIFQHALWQFDKSGSLQNLLHQLKYNHLYDIGVRMGIGLGRSLLRYPYYNKFHQDRTVLLPVPLHRSKFKIRGYNQARAIAEGMNKLTKLPVLNTNIVKRHKKTKTQTGFSMEKRLANMDGAFRVKKPQDVKNKQVIIVDDVFTTGATTFELARNLKDAGSEEISIATIAQA